MAHSAKGQHWRILGRLDMGVLPDKSTAAILNSLKTPQNRNPVKAHEGIASVSTDGGIKPTQPKLHDGNTAANAKFNAGTVGARETTDPARLIGAGIIKGN